MRQQKLKLAGRQFQFLLAHSVLTILGISREAKDENSLFFDLADDIIRDIIKYVTFTDVRGDFLLIISGTWENE